MIYHKVYIPELDSLVPIEEVEEARPIHRMVQGLRQVLRILKCDRKMCFIGGLIETPRFYCGLVKLAQKSSHEKHFTIQLYFDISN